jgi:hypothetical protein
MVIKMTIKQAVDKIVKHYGKTLKALTMPEKEAREYLEKK